MGSAPRDRQEAFVVGPRLGEHLVNERLRRSLGFFTQFRVQTDVTTWWVAVPTWFSSVQKISRYVQFQVRSHFWMSDGATSWRSDLCTRDHVRVFERRADGP